MENPRFVERTGMIKLYLTSYSGKRMHLWPDHAPKVDLLFYEAKSHGTG